LEFCDEGLLDSAVLNFTDESFVMETAGVLTCVGIMFAVGIGWRFYVASWALTGYIFSTFGHLEFSHHI